MLTILGRSWASTGGPGTRLGPLCAILGRSWSLCWRSWAALGSYLGGLWGALGPYVGGLGPLLGPMFAVLGRSWGYVGGPGPLLGPMFVILAALGALCWRSWAVLGREVVQTRTGTGSEADRWPKPEREQGPKGRGPPEAPRSLPKHLVPVPIFL